MATIEFNDEKSINVKLSSETTLKTEIKNLNYIPDYKKYEEERQQNEIERENYINDLKQRVLNGEFNGEKGEPGTTVYTELSDKPKINDVELSGNKTLNDLNIQEILQSGINIKTINNKSLLGEGNITISGGSGGTSDYNELDNVPIINKEGTTDNPVVLMNLDSGIYHVKGRCKTHSSQENSTSVDILISLCKIASNKMFFIDLTAKKNNNMPNGTFYVQSFTYSEDDGLISNSEYFVGSNFVNNLLDRSNGSIIAPTYSKTKIYSAGDYVTYASMLWVCKTAITTPEIFNDEKWEQVNVLNVMDTKIQSAIGNALGGSY